MRKINQKTSIFAFIMLILALFSCFFTLTQSTSANAEETKYTTVLFDLQKDETFDVNNYPMIANDYSMEVIQVAEGIDKELFVYVYQPSGTLQATSINLATGYRNKSFANYPLSLIHKSNALYKYVIENFTISEDSTRYYEFSTIFRPWDEKIDKRLETGETIDEVSYEVGKQYTFTNNICECVDIDLISITDKYVGFVRYIAGANFWGTTDQVDSHFVAFSTDKKIDKLLEADVYFQTQKKVSVYGQSFSCGEVVDNYSYMTSNDTAVFEGDYNTWLNSSYEWERIQTVDEFVSSEDFSNAYKMGILNIQVDYELDDEAKANIQDKQWVLRFYESIYSKNLLTPQTITQWTTVSNVSLLRLKFETEGRVYNLGVIDNKQTGTGNPDNKMTISAYIDWLILGISILIIAIILLFIFAPNFMFTIIKAIFNAIWYVLKGIWWVLTSPLTIFEKEEDT